MQVIAVMITFILENLSIMTLLKPLVLCFLLNVCVKWVFIFYHIFVLELLFFVNVIKCLFCHGGNP